MRQGRTFPTFGKCKNIPPCPDEVKGDSTHTRDRFLKDSCKVGGSSWHSCECRGPSPFDGLWIPGSATSAGMTQEPLLAVSGFGQRGLRPLCVGVSGEPRRYWQGSSLLQRPCEEPGGRRPTRDSRNSLRKLILQPLSLPYPRLFPWAGEKICNTLSSPTSIVVDTGGPENWGYAEPHGCGRDRTVTRVELP